MNRELYICIRFSKKVSEKAGIDGLQDLKKRFEKEMLPKIKTSLNAVDKGVKVWCKLG
jgi:hypothetical protein